MTKILSICIKCSDQFNAVLIENNKETAEYTGYVPAFFPEEHYGDYVELDINIETGQIVNWKKPTKEELKQITEPV